MTSVEKVTYTERGAGDLQKAGRAYWTLVFSADLDKWFGPVDLF